MRFFNCKRESGSRGEKMGGEGGKESEGGDILIHVHSIEVCRGKK